MDMKTLTRRSRFLPLIALWVLLAGFAARVEAQAPSPDNTAEGRFVSIDFNNVDIRVFIKFISELTGKNFIVDDRVKGKVTVISPEKITMKEAFRVFESVLEVHGFTTVPSGKVIKIVSSPEARTKSIETLLLQEASASPEDNVVTRIIPLKFADPAAIRKLFTPLISKNSVMLAYPPTGMLVVTDVNSNIHRLLGILEAIDVPGIGQEISVVHLAHADAEKISKIIEAIFKETASGKKKAVSIQIRMAADERTNTLILRGSEDDTRRVKGLISLLDREAPQGKGNIRVYYLENASAEDLAKVMMDLPGKSPAKTKRAPAAAVSSKVKVTADKATNSLIIQAEKEDYEILEEIIAKLDIPRSMVYIECLIMEVNVEKAFQVGVEWKAGGTTEIGDNNSLFGGGFSGSDYSSINGMYPSTTSTGGSLPSGFSLGIFGEAINIGGVFFPNIAAIIEAYKKDEDVQIISTPQILTTDNEEAKIYIGKNIPYQTKTSTNNNDTYNSFEYKDVGTTLKITPQISQDRLVRLVISQEVTKLETLVGNPQPTTLKRTIDTTVIVQDRSTVVIGGLIDDNYSMNETKVPLLGDIPILGWLFRSESKSRDKTNLFVFLTPRVIKNPGEAGNVYREKQDAMDRLREQSPAKMTDHLDSPSPADADAPGAAPIKLYRGEGGD
jgi:general secretion pathway protein D